MFYDWQNSNAILSDENEKSLSTALLIIFLLEGSSSPILDLFNLKIQLSRINSEFIPERCDFLFTAYSSNYNSIFWTFIRRNKDFSNMCDKEKDENRGMTEDEGESDLKKR